MWFSLFIGQPLLEYDPAPSPFHPPSHPHLHPTPTRARRSVAWTLANTLLTTYVWMPSRLFYVRQYTLEYPNSTVNCTLCLCEQILALTYRVYICCTPHRAGLTQGACSVDFWTAHDPLQWPQRLTQMLATYWQ